MNKIIVIVIPHPPGNGRGRVPITLAKGFIQQNCTVHIITFKKFTKLDCNLGENLKIHYFKRHYRWIPKPIRGKILAPFLDKFILEKCGKPNLVLSNLLPADRILCHSTTNTYLIIHNTMSIEISNLSRSKIELSKIYTKKPVVCVSKSVKTDFDQIFNTAIPSFYIYNPIDVELCISRALEFKPKYRNYLIHIGLFKNQKRHDILIKAYHKSKLDNPLILIGEGSLKNKYEKLVNDLGLEKKIFFVGFQSNPYPFIKHSKLMILSSDFEGLPTVILEALSLNIPVISTDCPSGPSEILPKKNLIPVGNIDLLAKKMVLAENKPEEYITNLKQDFYIENQTKKYLSLAD